MDDTYCYSICTCTSFINCTEEVPLLSWPTGDMLQIKNNCCNLNKSRHCKYKIIVVNKKIVPVNKSSCCKLSERKVCARTDGKRRTQYSCTKVKDRPARTPNVVFVVAATLFNLQHVPCGPPYSLSTCI